MKTTKLATITEGYGRTGLILNLNLVQCQALAEFFLHAEQLKKNEVPGMTYPENLQPFFDIFKQFNNIYDENLFVEKSE